MDDGARTASVILKTHSFLSEVEQIWRVTSCTVRLLGSSVAYFAIWDEETSRQRGGHQCPSVPVTSCGECPVAPSPPLQHTDSLHSALSGEH